MPTVAGIPWQLGTRRFELRESDRTQASSRHLVRFRHPLRLQERPHVPRIDTVHRQARLGQAVDQPLKERPGVQAHAAVLPPSDVNSTAISSGAVASRCSVTTWPASSTTHADVLFTETSRPTKCTITVVTSSISEVGSDLATHSRPSLRAAATAIHHRWGAEPPLHVADGN